jgi:predicted GTPase
MKFGAGVVAARQAGAAEIVDPRPYVRGSMAEVFRTYDVGPVLPAEGYSAEQLRELEDAIAAAPCDAVIVATPVDLRHVVRVSKPVVRVTYELEEIEPGRLLGVLGSVIARADLVPTA